MEPRFTWVTVQHLQEALAAVVAAVTLFALLWKRGGKRFLAWCRGCFNAGSSRRAMHVKIDQILKEVHPNGGSSLRDSIESIRSDVIVLKGGMGRQDSRWLATMEASVIPTWEADAKGAWTFANAAYLHLVDRALGDVLGYGWINCVLWSDRDRVQIAWLKAVAERRSFEEQFRIVTPTGSVKPINVVARPWLSGGELTCWIARSAVSVDA